MNARTPLHDCEWTRSAKGGAIRASYRGLHVSIYRLRNADRLRFRIDGELPASVTSTHAAVGWLWEKLLSRLEWRRVA